MNPTQLQQYIEAYQNASPSSIAMTPGGAQSGLTSFFNTPAAQMAYGKGPDELAAANMYNPAIAFATDPGVQLAIQAGLPAIQNNYAARGLGASGAAAEGLSQYMYNNYNNYVGTQEGLFNNYQNQLANLANMGANNTGGAQAYASGQNLASLLGQANLSTGSQIANANLNTGSNISSLLSNLGSLEASGYLNTGAAMANNMMQGSLLGVQLNNTNQASASQSANSLLSGQGAMNTAGVLSGGSF